MFEKKLETTRFRRQYLEIYKKIDSMLVNDQYEMHHIGSTSRGSEWGTAQLDILLVVNECNILQIERKILENGGKLDRIISSDCKQFQLDAFQIFLLDESKEIFEHFMFVAGILRSLKEVQDEWSEFKKKISLTQSDDIRDYQLHKTDWLTKLGNTIEEYRKNVVAVIANNNGKILFGERDQAKIEKSWQLPQGGVEVNENWEEALAREIKEETGIQNFEIIRVSLFYYCYRWPKNIFSGENEKNKYIGQRQKVFLVKISDDEMNNIQSSEELSRFKWASFDKMVDQVVAFKQQVYKLVSKDLGPLDSNSYELGGSP
ncbi:NUDIX domain-containing protein [Bacteriovoracaceae bacterium]|nr:NUDIX domain-containing protein [Bacteriovoracaceae bacterium]